MLTTFESHRFVPPRTTLTERNKSRPYSFRITDSVGSSTSAVRYTCVGGVAMVSKDPVTNRKQW